MRASCVPGTLLITIPLKEQAVVSHFSDRDLRLRRVK